ncbi:MAG: hypothetical protein MMC33_009456 [Icmadophila ericetorum]|nr:hypothetical protein [Icmadophila ericetorum]
MAPQYDQNQGKDDAQSTPAERDVVQKDKRYGQQPILGDFNEMIAEMNAPTTPTTPVWEASCRKYLLDPRDYVSYLSSKVEIEAAVYGVDFFCPHCERSYGKMNHFQSTFHLTWCESHNEISNKRRKEDERARHQELQDRTWTPPPSPPPTSSSTLITLTESHTSSTERKRGSPSEEDEGYASGEDDHVAKRVQVLSPSLSDPKDSPSSSTSTSSNKAKSPSPEPEAERKTRKRTRQEPARGEEPVAKRTRSNTELALRAGVATRSMAQSGVAHVAAIGSANPSKNPKRVAAVKAAWARRKATAVLCS